MTSGAATISAKDGARLIADAHRMTADLAEANPRRYWTDLVLTAGASYAGLAAMILGHGAVSVAGGLAAVLAIYRGISFVHEVSHLRDADVPHFKAGYNALIGVPFLVPSFMYEGVHNLHHAKSRYGTVADPEYLPLAHGGFAQVAVFVAVSALAPIGLLLRFAVLAPLSLLVPALRRATRERFSALAINPAFRREAPTAAQRRLWLRLEGTCALWALALVALTATGGMTLATAGAVLLVGSGIALLNQVRTLAAHHWENEGGEMTVAEQFLDSVTVPPPATLPVLWAPVGLRFHALHHLLPRLPYHNLAAAHARLTSLLPEASPYHSASHKGFLPVLGRLLAAVRAKRAGVAAGDAQPAE